MSIAIVSLLISEENEFFDIFNEVCNALVLVSKLWSLLFKMSHGFNNTIFCYLLVIILIFNPCHSFCLQFCKFFLMASFRALFQGSLEFQKWLQGGATIQDAYKVESIAFSDKTDFTFLASGSKLRIELNFSEVSLLVQVCCVSFNDLSQCHSLLNQLFLQLVNAFFDAYFFDIVFDLFVNKFSDITDLHGLLTHTFLH